MGVGHLKNNFSRDFDTKEIKKKEKKKQPTQHTKDIHTHTNRR